MKMDVHNVSLDGIDFQIHTMGALKAANLDRKVLAVILPTVSGIAANGLDTEIGASELLKNVGDGLMKLNDSEYQSLVLGMFSEVVALAPGQTPEQLDSEAAINKIFKGKILTIYKLIIEVMRHNGFSVFGLAEGGFQIGATDFFATGNKSVQKTGAE